MYYATQQVGGMPYRISQGIRISAGKWEKFLALKNSFFFETGPFVQRKNHNTKERGNGFIPYLPKSGAF